MFIVLGATLSNDYSTFTVFRSLQGLFGTVPQVIGLPIIHDMYPPEQWPRMINIWWGHLPSLSSTRLTDLGALPS